LNLLDIKNGKNSPPKGGIKTFAVHNYGMVFYPLDAVNNLLRFSMSFRSKKPGPGLLTSAR
jgi:hypothetical protein